MWRSLGVLGLLLLGVLPLTSCGGREDDAQARRDLDRAADHIVASLNTVVPALGRALGADYDNGRTEWSSCSMGQSSDASADASLQYAGVGRPSQAISDAAAALTDAGWKITKQDPGGALEATHEGITLKIAIEASYANVSLETGCVAASEEVASSYADRPVRHLPKPWPKRGIPTG